MGDPAADKLAQDFVKKAAELRAAESMQKDLEKVLKIATFRKGVYQRGMEGVILDEKIKSIDWWSRATKIATAVALGFATGAYVFTPAVMTWLSTTSVAQWGAAQTGLSATTLTLLARVSVQAVGGGIVQKMTSESNTAKGTSALGVIFEEHYKGFYESYLKDIKCDMLGLADARFVPGIVVDDFQFITDLERGFRALAREKGLSFDEAHNAQVRFCLDFWTKLEGLLQEAIRKNGWPGKIAQLTGEVNRLRTQLEKAGKDSK